MGKEPRTRLALRLRQRKSEILRGLPRLADQLPGVLTESYTRCGKSNCRCVRGKGHRAFSLTYMVNGKRNVDRVPVESAEHVRSRVEAGRKFQDAVREVLAANARLLILARQQKRRKNRKR